MFWRPTLPVKELANPSVKSGPGDDLRHLGQPEAADAIEASITASLANKMCATSQTLAGKHDPTKGEVDRHWFQNDGPNLAVHNTALCPMYRSGTDSINSVTKLPEFASFAQDPVGPISTPAVAIQVWSSAGRPAENFL